MRLTTIVLLICFSVAADAMQDVYEKVAVGSEHACAITKAGNIECWGLNKDGQATPPVSLKDVIELRLGAHQSCAVDKSHFLTCWGYDQDEFHFPKELEKVRVKTSFSTKSNMTCAVRESDGVPFCWGMHNYGIQTPPNLESLIDVSVNGKGICFAKNESVECWGRSHDSPPTNLNKIESVVMGDDGLICAIDSGNVICWNHVYAEQLPPADIGKVLSVEVGWSYSCSILQSHKVKCWGQNHKGAHLVPNDLGKVKSLSINGTSACAVTLSGGIRCWGDSLIPSSFQAK